MLLQLFPGSLQGNCVCTEEVKSLCVSGGDLLNGLFDVTAVFGLTSSKSEKEKEMLWLSLKHLHLSEMTCGRPSWWLGGGSGGGFCS